MWQTEALTCSPCLWKPHSPDNTGYIGWSNTRGIHLRRQRKFRTNHVIHDDKCHVVMVCLLGFFCSSSAFFLFCHWFVSLLRSPVSCQILIRLCIYILKCIFISSISKHCVLVSRFIQVFDSCLCFDIVSIISKC